MKRSIPERQNSWGTGVGGSSNNLGKAQQCLEESQVDSQALEMRETWPSRQRAVQEGYFCSRDQCVIQTRVTPPPSPPPISLWRI